MDELKLEVTDSQTSDTYRLFARPGVGGLLIEVEGFEESFVLDFANGQLRVTSYSDDEGDMIDGECALLPLTAV